MQPAGQPWRCHPGAGDSGRVGRRENSGSWPWLAAPHVRGSGICAVFALVVFARQTRPFGFALCAGVLLVSSAYALTSSEVLWRGRSFFGVYRISESGDPTNRSLVHGTTNHGGQLMAANGDISPTAYYTSSSPVAEVLAAMQARSVGQRVAWSVWEWRAGLLSSCWRRLAFFRDRPVDVWVAVESGYFDLMARCAESVSESVPVVLGDARLTLVEEPDGHLDVLVIDAFSSDAIPIHLLTREAVVLYMDKLAADGVLVMHISNRFLNLTRCSPASLKNWAMPRCGVAAVRLIARSTLRERSQSGADRS